MLKLRVCLGKALYLENQKSQSEKPNAERKINL